MILPWLHPGDVAAVPLLPPARTEGDRPCRHLSQRRAARADARLRRVTRLGAAPRGPVVTHAPHQRDELAALGLVGARARGVPPALRRIWSSPSRPPRARVARQSAPGRGIRAAAADVRRDPPVQGRRHRTRGARPRRPEARRAARRRGSSLGQRRGELRPWPERGLGDRVEIRDRFIPNDEAALLFAAAHASLLPYRSASQSGVVQLSFAYGCPVIATASAGCRPRSTDGVDGLLCEPMPRTSRRRSSGWRGSTRRLPRGSAQAARRSRSAATASFSTKRSGALLTASAASAPTRRSRSPATRRSKLGALVVVIVGARALTVPGVRRPRDWRSPRPVSSRSPSTRRRHAHHARRSTVAKRPRRTPRGLRRVRLCSSACSSLRRSSGRSSVARGPPSRSRPERGRRNRLTVLACTDRRRTSDRRRSSVSAPAR